MGAIIIGRMNIVRSTAIPRNCLSSSRAKPTPKNISRETTSAAKRMVTPKLSQKLAEFQRFM